MSLQGPLVVVADSPSGEVVEALSAAGAFPIVEATWADAPTAFMSVKPCAVVIADPGQPSSEANARMLCLQIATATGPMVPVVARMTGDDDLPVPIALAAGLGIERLIARLRAALRVRALHSTVLRRIESFGAEHGRLPELPVGDPLEEATVMIVGRGPLYPSLSTTVAERVGMLGALSVETAAHHLGARDIDGIVIGDGLGRRMVEAFLTVLAQDDRYRTIPVAMAAAADVPADLAEHLASIELGSGGPQLIARLLPLVRLHAFERRLKRMLAALDSGGLIDPETGLLVRERFWQELDKAVRDSLQQGHALSVGRFWFDGDLPDRARGDAARLLTRLTRDSDFACRDDGGDLLIAFGQTDLHSGHVIARRIAAALRTMMLAQHKGPVAAHVTLATLKGTDTLASLMQRVNGGEMVAAE
jgi:GGDEF domain-containing protein